MCLAKLNKVTIRVNHQCPEIDNNKIPAMEDFTTSNKSNETKLGRPAALEFRSMSENLQQRAGLAAALL